MLTKYAHTQRLQYNIVKQKKRQPKKEKKEYALWYCVNDVSIYGV